MKLTIWTMAIAATAAVVCLAQPVYAIGLAIYFSSMAYSDDMNNFPRRVNFVDDSMFALTNGIAALFVAFKWFANVGLRGEMIDVIY